MKNSISLNLYVALGVNEHNEVKMLDSFFEYKDNFKGCIGSSFYFVSPEEIEERNDLENIKENYDYLWKEEVQSGHTEDGLDSWAENFLQAYINNSDSLFVGHDTSYLNKLNNDETFLKFCNELILKNETDLKDLWNSERGTFECVGGGRCFSNDEKELTQYVSDERALLHDLARMFENGDLSIETVEEILVDNKIPFTKTEA